MRAWKLVETGVLECEDTDSQPVTENCVKIKVLETALTRNDKWIFDGKLNVNLPLILGETCVGMVSEVGENVKKLVRGNKVLAIPKICCHECGTCQIGKTSECTKPQIFGIDEDGFLRDFAVLNASDLYVLPDRVSSSDALYVDYINIAISTILRLNLEKGAHIAIVGATDIGIILAQTAIYYQLVPILIDGDQSRLELAESLGVYYTINNAFATPYKKILTITGGKMADGLAYAVSSELPFQPCLEYVKRGGTCAVIGDGYSDKPISGDFSSLVSRGISVVGISVDMKNVSSAINILVNKSISLQPFIKNQIDFSEVDKLFASEAFDELKDTKLIVKNT